MNSKMNLPLLSRGVSILIFTLLLAGIIPQLAAAQDIAAAPGDPPVILEQPIGRIASAGGQVALSVVVDGTSLHYQWYRDGQLLANDTNIFGATASVLNIDPAETNLSGAYSVIITNTAGAATSTVASVTIDPVVLQLTVIFSQPQGILLRITGPIGDVYRVDGSGNPTGPFTPYLYLTNRFGSVQTFRPFSSSPPNFLQARLDHMLPVLYPPRPGEARNSLRAYGKLNQAWRFEGSIDLLQWSPILTVTNTNGWFRFHDVPLQPPPIRFYRIGPP